MVRTFPNPRGGRVTVLSLQLSGQPEEFTVPGTGRGNLELAADNYRRSLNLPGAGSQIGSRLELLGKKRVSKLDVTTRSFVRR